VVGSGEWQALSVLENDDGLVRGSVTSAKDVDWKLWDFVVFCDMGLIYVSILCSAHSVAKGTLLE
jgi:hypothetical protein